MAIAKKFLEEWSRVGDEVFGIRVGEKSLMIGQKKMEVVGNDLVVDGRVFKGTEGLWKLVVRKYSKKFTKTICGFSMNWCFFQDCFKIRRIRKELLEIINNINGRKLSNQSMNIGKV